MKPDFKALRLPSCLLPIACLVCWAMVSLLSYPLFVSGWSNSMDHVEAELKVSNTEEVRVYWEDPKRHPHLFQTIDPDSGADPSNASVMVGFSLPHSKEFRSNLYFIPAHSGGQVEVISASVNGRPAVVTATTVKMPESGGLGIYKRGLICAIVVFLMGSLTTMAFVRAVAHPLNRQRKLIAIVLFSLSAALFWTAVFYPALMSEDSVDQWVQAVEGQFDNWHPPIMAMLMAGSRLMSDGPVFFTLIQGFLFWLAIGLALAAVLKPFLRAGLILLLVTALYPVFWTYTATLWKTTWTVIFICFSIPLLIYAVNSRNRVSFWMGVLALAIAACFRHNAVTLMAVPFLLYIFSFGNWRQFYRRLLPAAVAALVIYAAPKGLDHLPGIEDKAKYISCQFPVPPIAGMLKRMDRHGTPYASYAEKFDALFGEGKASELADRLDTESGNFVLYIYAEHNNAPVMSLDDMYKHRKALWALCLDMAVEHPGLFIRHRLNVIGNLLQLPGYFGPMYHKGIRSNPFGLGEMSLLPIVHRTVYSILNHAENWLFNRHYFHILVLLSGLIISVIKKNNYILVPSIIGLFYFSGYLIVDVHSDWRYLFPSFVCSWMILAQFISLAVTRIGMRVRQVQK